MNMLVARMGEVAGVQKLSPELIAFYAHRILLRVAIGMSNIFVAVFLFEYFGGNLLKVALVYTILYACVIVLTPVSSKLLRNIGIRTMMYIALPAYAVCIGSLYMATQVGSAYTLLGIVGYVVGAVVYRVFYWVPYQVDLSHLLDKKRRGRQVAFLQNVTEILVIVMPLIGGYIIAGLGYSWLFLVAGAIALSAMIPLSFIRNSYESYDWSVSETFRQLFDERNRRLFLGYFGDGIQTATLLFLWPMFVFILVSKEYATLGIIAAVSLLGTLVLRTVTGNLFDKWDKRRVIIASAIISSTGWLMKIFVGTPVQVIAADTYHGMGRVVNRTSIDAMTYEQAADNGCFIDEYTALKEMALCLGRLSALLFAGIVATFAGLTAAFIVAIVLAAVATLGTILLSRRVMLGR